jgi:hypothetical protein
MDQCPRGADLTVHTAGENNTFRSLAAVSAGACHARPETEDAGAQGVKPHTDYGLGDDVGDHVLGGDLPQGDRATCRPPADHGVLGRQPASGPSHPLHAGAVGDRLGVSVERGRLGGCHVQLQTD